MDAEHRLTLRCLPAEAFGVGGCCGRRRRVVLAPLGWC
jgi:hypothetical protein